MEPRRTRRPPARDGKTRVAVPCVPSNIRLTRIYEWGVWEVEATFFTEW